MSKMRSKRPASETRPARRSLVEFTATASRAVDDGSSGSPAADDPSRVEAAGENAGCTAATMKAAAPTSPEATGVAARGVELTASDSAADMLVKIAKDYQNSILDSIRLGLSAALDHAKNITETPRGTEQPAKGGNETRAAADLPSAFENAAAAFHAEALELINANVASGLNFARELAAAKSAAEIAALSGTQARRHCELMLKQVEVMKSLARGVTKSGSDEPDG